MEIKRINLSFNLENKEDREAYETICRQRFKTNFVCKAVLRYIKDINKEVITKKDLKNILIEVFKDLDISKIDKINSKSIEENELPKEVFDIFSEL